MTTPKRAEDKILEEELKKIYIGAEKVLDKNSLEYKEIAEIHREAWKKVADL